MKVRDSKLRKDRKSSVSKISKILKNQIKTVSDKNEAKFEALEEEKVKIVTKLENACCENKALKKTIESTSLLNIEVDKEMRKILSENKDLKAKLKIHDDKSKDTTDCFDMLDKNVQNKASEIERLRQEIQVFSFTCNCCAYKCDTDGELQEHVKTVN